MVIFEHRSQEQEILDEADLNAQELQKILEELDKVNRLLGGYRITLEGIQTLSGSTCYEQPLQVLDVGCGNGSMLREVAKWGRKKGIKMKLLGIDANEKAINIAVKCSRKFPEISFQTMDIRTGDLTQLRPDIVLCTLTLHHFPDKLINDLMSRFFRISRMGIVINDLHRSPWAYYLFKLYCSLFMDSWVAKKDGLTSILRSFKRRELQEYGKNLEARKQIITWKWAFRFQWIIIK